MKAALFGALLLLSSQLAHAQADKILCTDAIAPIERAAQLPPQLLHTIAIVESGRRDPQTGRVAPWPWTINAEGTGSFYESRDQAVAAVMALQARGVRSIDVGCMQINLMHHPLAFSSLEQAFDPAANVTYAARFLKQLFAETSAWPKAAGAYHSRTSELGADYQDKVMALWPFASRYTDRSALPASRQPLNEVDRLLARQTEDHERLLTRMRGPALLAAVANSKPARPPQFGGQRRQRGLALLIARSDCEQARWGSVQQPMAGSAFQVWANTRSKVYHRPGDRYYGHTVHGPT